MPQPPAPQTPAPTRSITLHVLREECGQHTTFGRLFIDGEFKWYTLEDALHDGPKVPGSTCIPAGRYKVIMTFSNRFQRVLPLLLNVPNFTGVRMHPGNTHLNTEGCILVGGGAQLSKGTEPVLIHSRPASDDLNQVIEKVTSAGFEVWCEVVNPEVVPAAPAPEARKVIV